MGRTFAREAFEQERDHFLSLADKMACKAQQDWSVYYRTLFVEKDLEIAVCFHPAVTEVRSYLAERRITAVLDELVTTYEKDRDERSREGKTVGNDVAVYALFASVCWLMEADDTGVRWVELGSCPAVVNQLDRRGVAYARAFQAFIRHTPFVMPVLSRCASWEQHGTRYASLVAAITRGEDTAPLVAEITKHFEKLNRTHESGDPAYHILDGCKDCPPSFNLLLEGIRSYKCRHYG